MTNKTNTASHSLKFERITAIAILDCSSENVVYSPYLPSIDDQTVMDIINSISDPLLRTKRVSNLIWQVYGGGNDDFKTREERADLTRRLIKQAQASAQLPIDLPEQGIERVSDSYVESEILLFGLGPKQLTHAALPKDVFAARDPEKYNLASAYGTPKPSLSYSQNWCLPT